MPRNRPTINYKLVLVTIFFRVGLTCNHIVDLESFTSGSAGYHAADVNNDGKINISDAIDILRHIVGLDTIDSFDLIDETGNRLNSLDPTALSNASQWMIVANGDVNMSGEFDGNYVVTMLDIT